MSPIIPDTLEGNQDIPGFKEFINEWLVKRGVDSLYGIVKQGEAPEFHKPNEVHPITYENKQYVEWLDGIYSKLSVDRLNDKGIFYWFKPFQRAVEILQESRLHLLSLEKQDLNDHSEALEFVQRYEYLPYARSYSGSGFSEKNQFAFGGVACFTRNFRNQQFWDDYAKSDAGVALGIRFIFKNDPLFQGFQPFVLKDIFYDTGYDLDFLNELRYLAYKKFNVVLSTIPRSLRWMCYYYKRDKYRWENETRLSFNLDEYGNICGLLMKKDRRNFIDRMEGHKIESHYFDESRPKFLTKVHFDNPFFKIEVSEIICGANVTDKQIDELRRLTEGKVLVWRRQVG